MPTTPQDDAADTPEGTPAPGGEDGRAPVGRPLAIGVAAFAVGTLIFVAVGSSTGANDLLALQASGSRDAAMCVLAGFADRAAGCADLAQDVSGYRALALADYPFMIGYGIALAMLGVAARRVATGARTRAAATLVIWAGPAAAAVDVVENALLLVGLGRLPDAEDHWFALVRLAGFPKWTLVIYALVAGTILLARGVVRRRSTP